MSFPTDGLSASAQEPAALHKRDLVYRSIKKDLVDGAYAPGDTLVIVDLAKEFGASRQPVPEALNHFDGI